MIRDAAAEPNLLGIRLRLARLRAGLSPADVAQALNTTAEAVLGWETSSQPIPEADLKRVAAMYRVDLERLHAPEISTGEMPAIVERRREVPSGNTAPESAEPAASAESAPAPAAESRTPAQARPGYRRDVESWIEDELKEYRRLGATDAQAVAARRILDSMHSFAKLVETSHLNNERLLTQLNVASIYLRQLLREAQPKR